MGWEFRGGGGEDFGYQGYWRHILVSLEFLCSLFISLIFIFLIVNIKEPAHSNQQ